MSKISSLIKIINKPNKILVALDSNKLLFWMSDRKYLKLLYKYEMGKKLELKNPTSFNEKLQWLKLHDHNSRYSSLVDKIEAKRIVGSIIGEEYIVPLVGTWDTAEEIEFDKLPQQVVLKCNHDQGSVMVIDDISKLDRDYAKKMLNKRLRHSPYYGTREWPYKSIKPKILAEKYLGKSIIDYKFYCFNGEPLFLYCAQGLTSDHSLKIDFFDMDWNLMPFYRTDYHRLGMIEKPSQFELMKDIAGKLSKDTFFVRIDLFEVDGHVYFSEFTLCPASGFMPFVPSEYDEIVGSWLKLPSDIKVD